MMKDIAPAIAQSLVKHASTVAVAESVTGGMLQHFFSSMENAAQFFQGGMTAYNIGQKCRHLSIDPVHAMQCNCVSKQVAEEMAIHACSLFCSSWGIAVTGYATAVPESGNKTFAYYAIAKNGKVKKSGILLPQRVLPDEVKQSYVESIVKELHLLLKE